jgi:hypothetical protein
MANLGKYIGTLVIPVLAAYQPLVQPASAITAELAKKCRALAIKTHPTSRPGRKATGAEKAQRDYFSACLAKGGKIED